MSTLEQMARSRSEYGRKKYQVPNPDPTGPWGDANTVEAFWFRDLMEDLREELADAQVYTERFEERTNAVSISTDMRALIDTYLRHIRSLLHDTFSASCLISDLVIRENPELVEDREDRWGGLPTRIPVSAE